MLWAEKTYLVNLVVELGVVFIHLCLLFEIKVSEVAGQTEDATTVTQHSLNNFLHTEVFSPLFSSLKHLLCLD